MSRSITYIILLSCFLYACQSSESSSDRIQLVRSPHFLEMEQDVDRLAAAQFMEDYLNILFDSTQSHRNSFWQSDILYARFDRFLKIGRAKFYLQEHPPQLLGIRKDQVGRYLLKIAFYREEFPEEIMELILAKDALNEFYFIEGVGERSKSFELRARGGLQFYYSPNCEIDSLAEQKVIDYNQSLANYFNSAQRSLRVIVCKDLEDYADLLGIDYATFLNLDRQTGGRALPDEDLYISANGSPYYPHELVHIYTFPFDPHPFMDEGMATYLGGSGGISLEEHLGKVAPKRDQFDFSKLPEDFYLYENFQASYLIGGMLLRLADQEYGGRDAVISLLSTGRDDQALYKELQKVFAIDAEGLDAFVKQELSKYDLQED